MSEAVLVSPLSIAIEMDEYRPSLAVTGKADHSNISRVVAVLDRLADEQDHCVSLDLGDLVSMDTDAAKGFASSAGAFKNRQKRLHLKCASDQVQGVFDRMLLSDVFCVESECAHKCTPGICGVASAAWEMDIFTLPSAITNCSEARIRVDRVAEAVGFSKCMRSDILLAVGEAVTNAVEHGSPEQDNNCFTVSCVGTHDKLCVSISDNGDGFHPENLPSLEEALFQEHGRGIHCMNAVMDEVSFDFNGGTTVRLVKNGF